MILDYILNWVSIGFEATLRPKPTEWKEKSEIYQEEQPNS